MQYVPADNVILARLRFQLDNQECFNTIYWQVPDSTSMVYLVACALNTFDWWDNELAASITNQCVCLDCEATDLSSATGPTYLHTPVGPRPGRLDGPQAPNNVSFSITFQTAGRGRSSRGRNYIVGVPQNRIGENTVSATWAEEVRQAYTLLMSEPIAPPDSQWVVISRFHGKDAQGKPLPRPSAIVQPVTNVKVTDLIVDSQRRRLPKRGK